MNELGELVFKRRIMKSGRGLFIKVPTALSEMVEHRGLYLVTLKPLEEADGDE